MTTPNPWKQTIAIAVLGGLLVCLASATTFPDPTADGELVLTGVDARTPQFKAGFRACQRLLPHDVGQSNTP